MYIIRINDVIQIYADFPFESMFIFIRKRNPYALPPGNWIITNPSIFMHPWTLKIIILELSLIYLSTHLIYKSKSRNSCKHLLIYWNVRMLASMCLLIIYILVLLMTFTYRLQTSKALQAEKWEKYPTIKV